MGDISGFFSPQMDQKDVQPPVSSNADLQRVLAQALGGQGAAPISFAGGLTQGLQRGMTPSNMGAIGGKLGSIGAPGAPANIASPDKMATALIPTGSR